MNLIALLPQLFALLARGDQLADVVKDVLSLIDKITKLVGGGQQTSEAAPVIDVAWVQQKLTDLGYDPGDADAEMGPKTQAAIVKFQKDKGITQDGWLGPETLAALVEAKKK